MAQVARFDLRLGTISVPALSAAALLVIAKPSQWRGFGGPIRLFFSVVLESLFSAALAPIRMLFHAKFVTLGLLGVAISWKSPPRDDAETHWADAFTQHWGGTVLGLAWAGFVYWLQPEFLLWLLPVVGSMMLAIPLSVLSSRVRPGRALRAAICTGSQTDENGGA